MTNQEQAPVELDAPHIVRIASDLVSGTLAADDTRTLDATEHLERIAPGHGATVLNLIASGVATGWFAGNTAQAPEDDRVAILARALRSMHTADMFGDCTEDGDHYPCRTIRAVNLVAGTPDDEPVLSADDLLSAEE